LKENNSFREIEYPACYTYKVLGDACDSFRDSVSAVFMLKNTVSKEERASSSGKYISISVTVEVSSYEELKCLYEMISRIDGLRYHL
jgi:putative lipoic acid-binding regulatory protein